MIKINKKQREMLWGEDGPYSEAKLIFETRILDNKISRKFITVEVSINPTTYEICKQNIEQFVSNPMVSQLLEYSDYRGEKHGYVSMAFSQLFNDNNKLKVLNEAEMALSYSEQTIIDMHNFVMQLLGIRL